MRLANCLLAVFLFELVAGGSAIAARITAYEPAVDTTRFQGQIASVNSGADSFVVLEREVCLVDFIHDGRRYQTAIMDLKGSVISADKLAVGQWVAIKGAVLKDNRIGARAIYLLPHQLTKNEAETYPVLTSEPGWSTATENH